MTGTKLLPRWAAAGWAGMVVVFVMLPLVAVTLVSLTSTAHISLPSDGVSFQWYEQLGQRDDFIWAGWRSIQLAFIAAFGALVLGAFGALAIVRYTFRLRGLVNVLGTSPLFIPMIMSGLAILTFFSAQGWGNHFSRLLVGHIAITLPFVLRTVTASLTGFNRDQELAAENLGATRLKTLLLVTFPQIRTGLAAGGVLALIVSFDNVALSVFLSGPQYSVLPVELYFYASYNKDPLAAAVSVAMILFSVAVIAILEKFFGIQRLLGNTQR